MSYNESDESDCQGFIPNKLIIKKRETLSLKEQASFLHFEPRYITGELIIKKQPPQSYKPATNVKFIPRQTTIQNQIEIKANLPTAQSIYLGENYQCIYTRFKKPFGEMGKASFSNDIIIKNLGRAQHFRALKNWKSDLSTKKQSQQKLKFDSKFEGGNLLCAFQSLNEVDTYILFMQNDTNTYGYSQWFYFSIQHAKTNRKYTFRIVNFKKKYSFFKKGMKPYIFSLEESRKGLCGWYMDGEGFQYYRSNFSQQQSDSYYTLQFKLQFAHENDFIMVCPSLPYSYSKLFHQINIYQSHAKLNQLSFQCQSISKTLGGNDVPYLKIFKQSVQYESKKTIVITARQHSGETWSSHLVDEIIKGVAQQKDPFYQWILQNFDLHIFPMVNVDGVIYGNFRCDLAGNDINRCWKDPSHILQPHVYKIRQAIQRLSYSSQIGFYLDLHTHSKQHGAFAYSCVDSAEGRKYSQLLGLLTPLFRYPACTFGISADKKTTARSQFYQLTKNVNITTIQLSAFGYRHPTNYTLQPFTLSNIRAIAQSLVNGIYYHSNKQNPIDRVQSYIEVSNIKGVAINYEKDEAVSGSDSDPQVDQIEPYIKNEKILKQLKIHQSDLKIKKTKTRVKKLKANIDLNKTQQLIEQEVIRISPINRYRALTQSKQKKQVPQTHKKQSQSVIIDPKNTVRSFKKILKMNKLGTPYLDKTDSSINIEVNRQVKPFNLVQFSLKKLPIYPRQQLTQNLFFQKSSNHIINLTPSKNLIDNEKLSRNKIITFYRAKKQILIDANVSQRNQHYKFLCVMSQSKKKEQIQRLKERKEKQNDVKLINRLKFRQIKQSTVLQRYMKDKNQQNSHTISKVWLKNFNRYSKSLDDSIIEK